MLLTIETEYHCFDTIVDSVLVDMYWLKPPNAFTPGGNNNLNAKYLVKGAGVVDFNIVIYSRWGGIVYSSNDINEGWDGTINNEVMTGQYSYYIEVRNIYDEIHKYQGIIQLLR